MPTVARLNIAPVKATRLLHPTEIRLERFGAVGDRDFFMVDHEARRISATQLGPMVQIRSAYHPEIDVLELAFPDGTVLQGNAAPGGDPRVVDLHGKPLPCHLLDGLWDEALSRHLGRPVRLARCDRPGDAIDDHPVTLVSMASVEELRRQAGRVDPLDSRRFRMSVELDGCSPHEEDTWGGRRVQIGSAILHVASPIPRCVVTTRDPSSGAKDFDTLQAIAAYRGVTEDRDINFGMYADVREPGVVRVGDPVELLLDEARGG